MIKGNILRDAFISGANNIANNRQQVDALNVFPVPDGDTGTNMSMTIGAAKRELERLDDNVTVSQVAQAAASALLRGARGNSGVILSLLFRGFAKGLAGKEVAEAADIANALELGVEAAYKAVMKPTEGTILTVARVASEHCSEVLNDEIDSVSMWREMLSSAEAALETTPELLPVLKKAGVVDAGGKGFVIVIQGMLNVIEGNNIIACQEKPTPKTTQMPIDKNAAGEFEGDITFTYCTEFIVLKTVKSTNSLKLRAYLESIGDSAVVVDDDDIIKCHVHTDNPGNALQEALKYGMITNVKIENMREQHATQQESVKNAQANVGNGSEEFPYVPVDAENEFGFVAIAAGDGIKQLFLDLCVDNVVSGGQTMNPSTDDILTAIHATPAKTVFVLPNNKNIIMAAEQTIKLADRNVCVLPTRTIPQGLSAMLSFDATADIDTNRLEMTKAFEKVGTGVITFAARDSDFDGHKIKKGEILALENGKVSFVDKDMEKATVKLIRSLIKKDENKDNCFVTIIYGQDVSEEQANNIKDAVQAKVPEDVEIALVDGGQPIYYLIISVE
ncbi:MAG: DAK2 domain-containing protein [Oscillospiraceae bacterium]